MKWLPWSFEGFAFSLLTYKEPSTGFWLHNLSEMQSSPQQSISIECCGETQDHTSKGWVSLLSISRCVWFLSFPWWASLGLLCSLPTPDPNRAPPAPHSVSWTEVAGSQDCINQISQNSHLRRNGWTQNKIKGPLLLSSSGQYIFQFLLQNILAAILLQEPERGKSVLSSLPAAWGKPSPFAHKQGWLHLLAQRQSDRNSLASHAFWGYSLSTTSEI